MRIVYDYQIMLEQRYGGVSRCFCELAVRLKKMYRDKVSIVAIGSKNYYLEELMGHKAIDFGQSQFGYAVKDKFIRINQLIVKKSCAIGRVDILHSTWYSPYLLEIDNCKQVITIHDMIQEKIPEYKEGKNLVKLKRRLMEKADKIIAVSAHTKQDILELYPEIPEKKIEVVYNGGCIKFIPSTCKYQLPDKYILYVGARGNYKNFRNLVKAMKLLMEKYEDIFLICAGGGAFTPAEKRMMGNIYKKSRQINADDKDLAYLYHHAIEFIFPSKYEGFGIPIIEAFSCYCPVVLSNASCFPEIAGDAALYFEPDDVNDMMEKMERFIIEKELRDNYIAKGRRRARLFTWERNARKMHQIYLDMMALEKK